MPQTMQLEVRRPDREPSIFAIEPGIYTVGSDDDCKIRIAHPDIDGRHAIMTIQDNGCWIEDLDAHSGTRLDGERIEGRHAVATGQQVGIGKVADDEPGVADRLGMAERQVVHDDDLVPGFQKPTHDVRTDVTRSTRNQHPTHRNPAEKGTLPFSGKWCQALGPTNALSYIPSSRPGTFSWKRGVSPFS